MGDSSAALTALAAPVPGTDTANVVRKTANANLDGAIPRNVASANRI